MPDAPARILVVDDDLATRLLACESLLAAGFACVEAEDGAAALAICAAGGPDAPDAVLLDIHMPGIDGYEVCRRLRATPAGRALSILVMTATDDVDAVQRAFAAGATDFLTKPLNLTLLAHRVRFMLRAAATAIAARETASRLERAQRLARIVHWNILPDGRFTWVSDPMSVLCPDMPADPDGPGDLLSLVHPDDRERVAAALATRSEHPLEFRLRLPDGSERVVHQDAAVDVTERGATLIGATQDVTAAALAAQQIAQLAFYDDTTGIPNAQMADRYLRENRPTVPRAAISIELGIRRLERLSGPARDALVRACAARVIELVRGDDLRVRLDQVPVPVEELTGPVLVARSGPDELVVLTTATATAASLARRLADALATPMTNGGREVALSPRVGVAVYPDVVEDARWLVTHAQTAMGEADSLPPRDLVVFTAAIRDRRTLNAELGGRLAAQLVDQPPAPCELTVEYLPRVDHGTRTLIGVRARPRWRGVSGDIAALEAICASDPVLRDRVAMWTLRTACQESRTWMTAGAELRLAVEVPQGVVSAATFAGALHRILGEVKLAPRLLDLELTDLSTTDEALSRTAATVRVLRARGTRIATAQLDDTCSLRVLRRLPLDAIRFGRATLERLGPSFLGTIVAIARALDLRVAASEIDSPAALAALEPHALDEVSGGWAGDPVPAAQVAALDATSESAAMDAPTLHHASAQRVTLVT